MFSILLNMFVLTLLMVTINKLQRIETHLSEVSDVLLPDLEVTSDALSETFTPVEIERMKRDNDFDERIRQLESELGTTLKEPLQRPMNLPHNIIDNEYLDLPDVETAD